MNYYPNYNPYQQIITPQYNPYPSAQPIQQPIQNNSIAGRMVDDFANIVANDVPMDGSAAVFVKRDMTEIQAKRWNPDGTISTVRFEPQKQAEIPKTSILSSDEEKSVFDTYFARLNERLDHLEGMIAPQKSVRQKKENENES